MGEKISAPSFIFDYNMLLGIILFYIKKCFCDSSEPKDWCWWLEGPAPQLVHLILSVQVPSEARPGKQGGNQSRSLILLLIHSFCDFRGHI